MPLLENLGEIERKMLEFFPAFENEDCPFTPLTKPLNQTRLAIVTTAGVHLRSDKPFLHKAPADSSYRAIPSSAPAHEVVQSHSSIGFDRSAFYKDLNVTFPIERVRDLAKDNLVGSIATNHYSFNGAQRDPSDIVKSTAPEVALLLKKDNVDCVLITPT